MSKSVHFPVELSMNFGFLDFGILDCLEVKTNVFSQRGEVNAPHFHSFTVANFPHGLWNG